MTDPRKTLGRWGEDLAARYLLDAGYLIIERNYRCAVGEMDIVARHGTRWVFVEVKTRRGNTYGKPEDAITRAKALRLLQVAETYLTEKEIDNVNWRIDLVAVEMDHGGRLLRVDQIQNAVTGW
jgi:putative endonuclease